MIIPPPPGAPFSIPPTIRHKRVVRLVNNYRCIFFCVLYICCPLFLKPFSNVCRVILTNSFYFLFWAVRLTTENWTELFASVFRLSSDARNTRLTAHHEPWGSVDQTWVWPTNSGSWVLSCRSYHRWWSMGTTLIVDDPELTLVLSGTHLPTSEWWKAELA